MLFPLRTASSLLPTWNLHWSLITLETKLQCHSNIDACCFSQRLNTDERMESMPKASTCLNRFVFVFWNDFKGCTKPINEPLLKLISYIQLQPWTEVKWLWCLVCNSKATKEACCLPYDKTTAYFKYRYTFKSGQLISQQTTANVDTEF